MKILVDTREHPSAIKKILRTFERNGVAYEIKKLDVGDYCLDTDPSLVVDRKHNLQEVSQNLCSPDKGRFFRELKRAKDNGIHIVFLVEHGPNIKSIEQIQNFHNKYSRVSGRDLMEAVYRCHIAWGVDFVFCDKRSTGKKILELLGADKK